jgi:dihydroorotase-like cyclic amidohydrolase
MRLTPPLRQGADRDALRAGLADGTIDALVSDHNPVAEDMKNLPFGEAEPGATGLELLLAWRCAGVPTAACRWPRRWPACHQRPGAGAG